MNAISWPTMDERWDIVQSYLSEKGATDQAIRSFNSFIDREFRHLIYSQFQINVNVGLDLKKKFQVACTNVVIQKPILLNNDLDINTPAIHANAALCRLLKSSLVSPVYLTLSFEYENKRETCNNMLLCYVPIMAGSKISLPHTAFNVCDQGYFVLGGSEKTIVAQERKIDREILVRNRKCQFQIPNNPTVWWLEQEENKNIVVKSKVGMCDLAIFFAHFDVGNDQVFPPSVRLKTAEWKQKSPHERYDKFKKAFPRQKEIHIKHMFASGDKKYLKQLLYMSKSLAEKINVYDRDHLAFKRVESVSELLLCVARKSLKRVVASFQKKILHFIEKNPGKSILKGISRSLDSRIVTESLFYSLQTGNWPSANSMTSFRTGVCQQRSNYNFSSVLSQARRLKSGDDRRSILQQREVRGEHYGYICPYDTSEGRSCGINKEFSTMSTLSIEFDSDIISKIIHENNFLEEKIDLNKKHLVFVNGVLEGQTKDKESMVNLKNFLKQHKRMGVIDRGVSISYNFERLNVRSDAGRILRPLFILKNLSAHLRTTLAFRPNFDELLKGGIVEYVDTNEEEALIVATGFDDPNLMSASHCEIHPSLILSMNALANNPFCSSNQGPRISYQSNMQKQAMSCIVPNYRDLNYSRSHYLLYGQRPLCATKLSAAPGMPQGSGLNCIVAIMCYGGWNQEDSICISKSFIERGGFRTLDYKTFNYSGSEKITKDVSQKPYCRSNKKLFQQCDDDGLPTVGRKLGKSDIILAKEDLDFDEEPQDTSVKARDKEGVVDKILIGTGRRRRKGQGEASYKININTYKIRTPVVGDKFASQHAQKGILAYIIPEEDLPFTMDGIKPDIIMSPHALPTRMTVGQLMESLGGRLACENGIIEDATPFTHKSVQEIGTELKKYGFSKYGDTCLMDGHTGEMLTSNIFLGPVYYQRLRHMVDDKLHARVSGGPKSVLTRQPPPGKNSNGGHR